MRSLPLAVVLVIFVDYVNVAIPPEIHKATSQKDGLINERTTKTVIHLKRESNDSSKNKGGAQLANLVAKKIKRLTKDIFKHAKTDFDRRNLMEQLEKIILDTAKRHNFSNNDIQISTKLILEGIEFALESMGVANPFLRRSNISPIINLASVENKVKTDGIAVGKKLVMPIITPTLQEKETTLEPTKRCRGECSCIAKDICDKVAVLKTIQCRTDGSNISIRHLCDGEVNCGDASDETKCKERITEKVRMTEHILRTLENSIKFDHCFQKHNESLLKVLNSHRAGLKIIMAEKIANQGAVVINLIAIALGESFCSPQNAIATTERNIIQYGEANKQSGTKVEKVFVKTSWSARSCSCKLGLCKQANCDSGCRAFCLRGFLLTRWQCPTMSEKKSIALNAVCDGVPDCMDGSDETNCYNGHTMAKFEAKKILNQLIDEIKTKLNTNEYSSAIPQLLSLIKAIKRLQPTAVKSKVNANRDRAIKVLAAVYVTMVRELSSEKREEAVYRFLRSVNNGVVEAVKRQTPVVYKHRLAVCKCLGSGCASARCPRACSRQCAAAARLRFVQCAGTKVPISAICNHTRECIDGSDERNCNTGYCHKYHVMMLKRSVEAVVKKYEGTFIGVVLSSWETKMKERVESKLRSSTVNRDLLAAMVSEGLDDLVGTYATMMERRRSGDGPLLKAMETASKQLKDILKMCAY